MEMGPEWEAGRAEVDEDMRCRNALAWLRRVDIVDGGEIEDGVIRSIMTLPEPTIGGFCATSVVAECR